MQKVKGFEGGRKNLIKLAQTAIKKAGAHAFRDRRAKKRTFRALWQIRINAAIRPFGMSYSVFMGALKKKGITIDRKVLSELGAKMPHVFAEIVKAAK